MTAEVPTEGSPVRVWECAGCDRTFVAQGETCPLCGVATKDITGDGRGRLTSWTTIHVTPPGVDPYVIGWAELDGVGQGVLGRVTGDASALRRDLPLVVRQTAGEDGWPRLWLEPEGAG